VSAVEPFVASRVFDAPRERVWQAWTEAERLKQWFAPRGMQTKYNKVDLRPGGTYHYCLRAPDGKDIWGKWAIREVKKPEKLVFVVSFSDEKGGVTRHPMNPKWPLYMHSTVTFEAQGAKATKVTVSWIPLDASETESKTFEEGRDGMKQGWGGTMDHLVEYLKKS
jgi:uncharacterized protein YndB with AHSA1/START domain